MSKTPFSFLSLRMGGAILGLLLGTLLHTLPCEALTLHHPLGPSLLAATGILDRSSLGSVPLVLRPWRSLEEAGAVLAKEPGGLAVLPTTTAAFLAERGIPLHLLGVHLWKAFFLLSPRENPLKDLSAAGGTRILVPFGRGDVADGVLRTLLKASSVRNVKLLYASPQEGVALLAAGKIDGAVLPEPFATLARRGGAHALDLQVEWARRFGGRPRLPVTGLFRVGTLDPATEQAAVAAFQRSVARALRDPQGAGAVAAETLHMEPALVREAGRRLTLEFVPPRAAAPELRRFFEILSRHAPETLPPNPDRALDLP